MGKSVNTPATPNYAEIIPLQERSNINQFNAMLGAQRSNSITPFGSQMWFRPNQRTSQTNPFPSQDPRTPRPTGGGTPALPPPNLPPSQQPWMGSGPSSAFRASDPRSIKGGATAQKASYGVGDTGNEDGSRPPIESFPGGPEYGDTGIWDGSFPPMYPGQPQIPGGTPDAGPGQGSGQVIVDADGKLVPAPTQPTGPGASPGMPPGGGGAPAPGGGPNYGGGEPSYGDLANQEPWTFVQSLSPEQQWLYNQDLRIRAGQGDVAEGMIGRVQQEYANTPNFANLLPEYSKIGGPRVQERISAPGMEGRIAGPDMQGRVQGPGQFGGLGGEVQYGGGPFDRTRAEDAIYQRQMRFLEPQLQQQESRAHQRLVSQGFDTRGDAYNEQMRNLGEQQFRQRADAADRAILGGGQEASSELARILQARQQAQGERQADFSSRLTGSQFDQGEAQRLFGQSLAGSQFGQGEAQRLFGQGLSGAQFNLGAGQQRFGQEAASSQFAQSEAQRRLADALTGINVRQQDRGRLLNELNSFRTGNQLQLPQVSPTFQTPNLAGIDRLGLAQQDYQNQMGQANAQSAAQGNFMSGLMGMAGSALGGPMGGMVGTWLGNQFGGSPSDIRLKTNVKQIGKTQGGHNWYTWDWKDGSGSAEGVIAQEVPEASFVGPNGYLWVDYSKVH